MQNLYIYIILNLCCLNKYFSNEDDNENCCTKLFCDCFKEKDEEEEKERKSSKDKVEDINKNYTPIKIDIKIKIDVQKITKIILKYFLEEDNKNIENQDLQDINENNNIDPFTSYEQPQNDKDNNILSIQNLYKKKINNIIYYHADFYYRRKDVAFLFRTQMNRSEDGRIIFKDQSIFKYKNKSENKNNWAITEDNDRSETIFESEEQLKKGLYLNIKADLPGNIIVINEEEKKLP